MAFNCYATTPIIHVQNVSNSVPIGHQLPISSSYQSLETTIRLSVCVDLAFTSGTSYE